MLIIKVMRKMGHGIFGKLMEQTQSNPIMKTGKRMVTGSGGEKMGLRIKKAIIRRKKNMVFGQFGTIQQEPLIINFMKKHLLMGKQMGRLQNGIKKVSQTDKVS